jgi:hypothetical protein
LGDDDGNTGLKKGLCAPSLAIAYATMASRTNAIQADRHQVRHLSHVWGHDFSDAKCTTWLWEVKQQVTPGMPLLLFIDWVMSRAEAWG